MELGTERTKRNDVLEHNAANPDVLNSGLNRLRNNQGVDVGTHAKEKDKTPTTDDSRFFYTGIDWTINLLPSIILIKLAFLGGWYDLSKYYFIFPCQVFSSKMCLPPNSMI